MLKFILGLVLCALAASARAQVPITTNPQPGDVPVITANPNANIVAGPLCNGPTCVGPSTAIPSSYFASATNVNSQISGLSTRINRESEGVALSIAQSRTATLAPGKSFALSLGFGGFQNMTSAGFGAVGKLTENLYLSGGWGVGLNSGVVGGGGAVSFQW